MKKILTTLFTTTILISASFSQDRINKKVGGYVEAKVLEITTTEIKYKKIENLNGPTYSILKSEVSYIKYGNQTIERFEEKQDNFSMFPGGNPFNQTSTILWNGIAGIWNLKTSIVFESKGGILEDKQVNDNYSSSISTVEFKPNGKAYFKVFDFDEGKYQYDTATYKIIKENGSVNDLQIELINPDAPTKVKVTTLTNLYLDIYIREIDSDGTLTEISLFFEK